MKAKFGLFNPKNAAPESDRFQEGLLHVVSAKVAVTHREARQGQDEEPKKLSLVLGCLVLDQDTQEPKKDPDGQDERFDLILGFGSDLTAADWEKRRELEENGNPNDERVKMSIFERFRPGKAASPDSDDIEDQGDELDAEGNTIFVVDGAEDYKIHPRTGLMVFMKSLAAAGWKEEYFNRVWAPDFVGSTFFVGRHLEETDQMEVGRDGKERKRTIPYKVVKQIIRAGYEKKAGAQGAGGKGKPTPKATTPTTPAPQAAPPATAAGGKGKGKTTAPPTPPAAPPATANGDAATADLLEAIMTELAGELSGQSMTLNALAAKVGKKVTEQGGKATQIVPVLKLLKSQEWLEEQALVYGMSVDGGNVQFE